MSSALTVSAASRGSRSIRGRANGEIRGIRDFRIRNTLPTDSPSPDFSRRRHPLGVRPGSGLKRRFKPWRRRTGHCSSTDLASDVAGSPEQLLPSTARESRWGSACKGYWMCFSSRCSPPQCRRKLALIGFTCEHAATCNSCRTGPTDSRWHAASGRRHPYSTHSNSVCPFGRFAYHEASLWRIVFSPTWSSGIGVMSLSCTSSR